MNENYTVEDFAQANLATKGKFGVARRIDPRGTRQWYASNSGQKWLSDDGMVRDGWVPVVEVEDPEAVVALIGRQAEELADLWEENDRLERILQDPLLLKALEAAWEAAEVPTDDAPMRQGDVYISTVDRDDRGFGYLVAAAGRNGTHMHFNARILSRAPREPWVELAGVLHDVINQGGNDHIDVDSTAARLYAEGVRVTGGGDDE